jgi:hypothetical protein
VTRHVIPGQPGAVEFNVVDVIESDCRSYELEYRHQNQGIDGVRDEAPLTFRNDQTASMFDGSPQTICAGTRPAIRTGRR